MARGWPPTVVNMGHVERLGVDAQLLDGAGAESVASAEERHETVRLDVVGNLGERGALADAVDAHKHHHVRPLAAARLLMNQ